MPNSPPIKTCRRIATGSSLSQQAADDLNRRVAAVADNDRRSAPACQPADPGLLARRHRRSAGTDPAHLAGRTRLLVAADLCAGHVPRSSQPAGRQAPRRGQRHPPRRSRVAPARAGLALAAQSVVLQERVRLRRDRAVSKPIAFRPASRFRCTSKSRTITANRPRKAFCTLLGSTYECSTRRANASAAASFPTSTIAAAAGAATFTFSTASRCRKTHARPISAAARREGPPKRQDRPRNRRVRNPRQIDMQLTANA